MRSRYDIALPNGYFNLAIERNIARHAVGRRAIAKDYTLAATLKNERYFDNVIKDFISALDKNFASVGKICDFTVSTCPIRGRSPVSDSPRSCGASTSPTT